MTFRGTFRPGAGARRAAVADGKGEKKAKLSSAAVWREARELVWQHRRRLGVGLVLMLINRGAGFVLPLSTKYFFDNVLTQHNAGPLRFLALLVGGATVVQAATSFGLSQILGVAAQRAITEMRRAVQSHLIRLPIRAFDSTQTGQLVSRVMTDAEGIRNLVGTGLVQLVGGTITAIGAFAVLLVLNWRLTAIISVLLAGFAGGMAYAFRKLRPIFRIRGQINAEVTGRLVESISGIRVVKAYTAERRERLAFARGVNRLLRNVAATMTGISATGALSTVVVGLISTIIILVEGTTISPGG